MQKLKAWLEAQGVKLPRKQRKRKRVTRWSSAIASMLDDIEKLLAGNLPNEHVRKVLEIRLQAGQSAVKKVDRMLVMRCRDGRVRNNYRMYGRAHRALVRRRCPAAESETP